MTLPGYTIESATFSKNKTHIEYPQIKGLDNDKRERAINELIKNDILDYLIYKTLRENKNPNFELDFEAEAKYSVKFSTNDTLSISYHSSLDSRQAWHHPRNDHFGITIDLRKATRLQLSDFVSIDLGLVQVIKQSPSIAMEGSFFYVQKKDDQAIIKELYNYSDRDFYITPSSIVICVYISHVAGDRALVKVIGTFSCYHPISLTPDRNLVFDSEYLLISFKIENSEKKVIICISKDYKPYIVYRFRSNDSIELEYPADKENSWANFKYYYEKCTNTYSLVFNNKGYEYRVYLSYNSNHGINSCGVKVTDTSNCKVTDIKGDVTTLIGDYALLVQYSEFKKRIDKV